jgi:hypothetical protein
MATARAGPGLSDRIERNALRATFTGFPQSRPPRGPARARLVLPVLRPRATTDTATSPTLAYVAVNELRYSKETERDRRLWGGRHVSSTGAAHEPNRPGLVALDPGPGGASGSPRCNRDPRGGEVLSKMKLRPTVCVEGFKKRRENCVQFLFMFYRHHHVASAHETFNNSD